MVFWDRNLIAALVFWLTFPIDLKKWVCIVGQFNLSLGGWKGNFTPCWFSLNNSETVKAATLALCNFQWHFIRDVRAKFGILYSPQSPDIGQNSERGIPISRFLVNPLEKEIVITPEPVMILTWDLDQ